MWNLVASLHAIYVVLGLLFFGYAIYVWIRALEVARIFRESVKWYHVPFIPELPYLHRCWLPCFVMVSASWIVVGIAVFFMSDYEEFWSNPYFSNPNAMLTYYSAYLVSTSFLMMGAGIYCYGNILFLVTFVTKRQPKMWVSYLYMIVIATQMIFSFVTVWYISWSEKIYFQYFHYFLSGACALFFCVSCIFSFVNVWIPLSSMTSIETFNPSSVSSTGTDSTPAQSTQSNNFSSIGIQRSISVNSTNSDLKSVNFHRKSQLLGNLDLLRRRKYEFLSFTLIYLVVTIVVTFFVLDDAIREILKGTTFYEKPWLPHIVEPIQESPYTLISFFGMFIANFYVYYFAFDRVT